MGVKNRKKTESGATVGPKHFAACGVDEVRTPWGVFDATRQDEDTRDPLEPDDPIQMFPQGRSRAAGHGAAMPSAAADASPAPVTPRELYEMLISPAALPSRSSPARVGQPAPAAAASPSVDTQSFPPQADLVLSALEAGQGKQVRKDRRGQLRRTYRVRGVLHLYSEQQTGSPRVLYTRDIHSRGVGFITQHRLPLGYGGEIELPDPNGGPTPLRVSGTLLRCREAGSGWFEGSLYFDREQPEFEQE